MIAAYYTEFRTRLNKYSDPVNRLLVYASAPRSREELPAFLRLTNHLYNYKRHIEPLINRGWLAVTIPDKPHSRNWRHQLTPSGRCRVIKNSSRP